MEPSMLNTICMCINREHCVCVCVCVLGGGIQQSLVTISFHRVTHSREEGILPLIHLCFSAKHSSLSQPFISRVCNLVMNQTDVSLRKH